MLKSKVSLLIITFFLLIFVIKSINIMEVNPFYDFDEAHRAENARRMKDHQSYLVPLTGSTQDRIDHLKIPFKENPNVNLYYHLERPGLIYWFMMASTSIFGDKEFAYRLPSFLLGFGTILLFIFFAKVGLKKQKSNERHSELVSESQNIGILKRVQDDNVTALTIGLLALITSADLWLSSQYAQLDTGLTFFLFLSLLSLITFAETKKNGYLKVSGISFALAVLSKGAPAVIFGIFLLFLLIYKKISRKDILKFIIYSFIILIPWITLISIQFGFKNVIEVFSKFALTSSSVPFIHIQAPIYWYIRWWFEALRPGWVLFLSLVAFDVIRRNLDWKKVTLLAYIFGSLIFFSVPVNKIWWYVLPIMPAMAYYIFLSASNLLRKYPEKIVNLSLIIVLASLPIFLNTSSKIGLLYGIILTGLSFLILVIPISTLIPAIRQLAEGIHKIIFLLATFYALFAFYSHFPEIKPYAKNVKEVSLEFKDLKIEGKKCLWVDHLPLEAVLYYSNAGQVNELNQQSLDSILYKSCINNFLITPLDINDKDFSFIPKKELVYKKGRMNLLRLGQKEPQ